MVTHVQGKVNTFSSAGGTSMTVVFGAAVGSGNAVIGAVTYGDPAATISSIKDNASPQNSYTVLDTISDNPNVQSIASFYLLNVANGPTQITVTFGVSVGSLDIVVDEYSGIVTTSGLDGHTGQYQSAPGTGSNAISSGAFTTAANGDLVWGATCSSSGGLTGSAGTGFVLRESDATVAFFGSEDEVQGTASASTAATFTASTGGSFITVVVALKAAGLTLTATALADSSPTLGVPSLNIITPLTLGGFVGNATSSGPVLDFGLNRLHANANAMYICSTVPTTYVQATTTYALGNVTPGAGTLFGTMSNGSPAGRIVNSVAITTGAVTTTGTPNSWAVVDTVNLDLLITGTASGFSGVTSGQTWQLGAFDVHMSNT